MAETYFSWLEPPPKPPEPEPERPPLEGEPYEIPEWAGPNDW